MIDPFDSIGKPSVEDYEECEGSFGCQERGCYLVARTAKYFQDVRVLTWICEDEHISKIEGFDL